jgi:hypothetical protein
MTPEELRDLQERVALVTDMVGDPGWVMLVDRARHTMGTRQVRIVQGKCQDHEEYARECAFVDGMRYVLELPERLELELAQALALIEEEREEEAQLVDE